MAVLNSTIEETASKGVLTQLNELSQFNRIHHEFNFVGEEVSCLFSLFINGDFVLEIKMKNKFFYKINGFFNKFLNLQKDEISTKASESHIKIIKLLF